MRAFVVPIALMLSAGCQPSQKELWQAAWTAPCQDESVLLATTAGSPSSFKCSNRGHRMRVEIASAPANEEFGALVFCECVRPGDGADGGGK